MARKPTQNTTPENHTFRSRCSIARCLEIVGDKWTMLIVRDLMWHGKHTFRQLHMSEEHIPTNILAQRLNRLLEWEIIRREAYQEKPIRYQYYLTTKGEALEPVLRQTMAWGHLHLGGGFFDPKQGKTISEGNG